MEPGRRPPPVVIRRVLPLLAALLIAASIAAADGPDWTALLDFRPLASAGGERQAAGRWEARLEGGRGSRLLAAARLSGEDVADWLGAPRAPSFWIDGRAGLFLVGGAATQRRDAKERESSPGTPSAHPADPFRGAPERVVIEALFDHSAAAGEFVDAADRRLRRGAGRADRWTILQRAGLVRIVIDLARGGAPQPLPPDRWERVEFPGKKP